MSFKSIESFGKKILKTGLAIGLATSAEAPVQAENFKSDDKEKEKTEQAIESTTINPSPESYDASEKIENLPWAQKEREERIKNPLAALLKNIQNSEITKCSINIYDLWTKNNAYDPAKLEKILTPANRGTAEHAEALKTYLEMIKYQDSVRGEIEKLKNKENKFRESELNILSDTTLKSIYEKGPIIIEAVENSRSKLINIVSSKQYLEILKSEFDCSLDEAKKHQEVRVNNLKNVNIIFKNSTELKHASFFNNPADARYNSHSHEIELPYDLPIDALSQFALHEFIHSIVMGNLGLSTKAIRNLNSTAFENKKYSQQLNNYFTSPAERYVRLKMLEIDLDEAGIKKIGEKISKVGYKKMMQWLESKSKDNNNYSFKDGLEFLETTKDLDSENARQILNNLFQEIADNQEDNSSGSQDNYRHPDWDYNNPNNLA